MDVMEARRRRCVAAQIEARGVADPLVLAAMRTVPRELFAPRHLQDEAYDDTPLPIGAGQTISQPYIVAFMIAALRLKGGERVLEVGAGSGYAAAVLAEIAGEVYAIERIAELADLARANLRSAGYERVDVRCADGSLGWPDAAPFDAILVSAGAAEIPNPLRDQLAVGGRMLVPVGPSPEHQELLCVRRVSKDRYESEDLGAVRFVPLITGSAR